MARNGPGQVDRSLRGVLLVAGIALLAQVLYHVLLCRYDLIEDEAHYWLWSRFPDWSYYSKGPGVAWAIWLSTKLFGDAEWAVRLPSAIAGAIGAFAAGGLARDLAAWAQVRAGEHREAPWATPGRVGTAAALGYVLTPALQGASVFMTIDAPYVACWAVACWACWRALQGSGVRPPAAQMSTGTRSPSPAGSPWLWPLVGVAIAIGFLFKYTMLLLVPGLIAFALWRRRSDSAARGGAARLGVPLAIGIVLALAGLAPVLVWNAQHGWPTVKHLLGHLGLQGGDVPIGPSMEGGGEWSPWWLPELIGEQIAMTGPWLALGLVGVWRALRPARPGRDAGGVIVRRDDPRRVGRIFLACAALPILLFYAIVSLIAEPEGNWPMGAYATLVPLAAWLGADALVARRAERSAGRGVRWRLRGRVILWRAGLTYAIVACVILHSIDRIGDLALALQAQPWFRGASARAGPREPRDIAGRIRGAREMAAHVHELMTLLNEQTGREPFILAQHYGRASQLAYYLRTEHPEVLCAMPQTGGRRSQFDVWPWTTLDLPHPELLGRPAVIVSSIQPHLVEIWSRMFDRVQPIPGERLRGESKPDRSAFLGYGWKYQPPTTPATPPTASPR